SNVKSPILSIGAEKMVSGLLLGFIRLSLAIAGSISGRLEKGAYFMKNSRFCHALRQANIKTYLFAVDHR
ncbi:MAG TPA: hypothetical protein DCS35_04595, partial [Vibrio sp.]|nr:hypothetical protein [Vibrio sp.]